jgi:hypothetical protein
MPSTVIYVDTNSMWVWFYTAAQKPVGKIFSGLTTMKSIGLGFNYKRSQLSEEASFHTKGAYPALEYALYKKGPFISPITVNTADKKVMLRYAIPQAEIQAELDRRGRRLAAMILAARLPAGVVEKVMDTI